MKTEILTIMDRSGSMESIRTEVIGGYNAFLKDQREVPGEARVTLAQFDHEYTLSYQAKDIKEAPELNMETFVPRGWTALLDAIGKTLLAQRKRITEEKWADKVIVCIITDGAENSSKEFKAADIKALVTAAQEWGGWTFVFQGANIDAFSVGQQYGISSQFTSNFAATAKGTMDAYASTSHTLRSLRTPAAPAPTPSWNVPTPTTLSDKA